MELMTTTAVSPTDEFIENASTGFSGWVGPVVLVSIIVISLLASAFVYWKTHPKGSELLDSWHFIWVPFASMGVLSIIAVSWSYIQSNGQTHAFTPYVVTQEHLKDYDLDGNGTNARSEEQLVEYGIELYYPSEVDILFLGVPDEARTTLMLDEDEPYLVNYSGHRAELSDNRCLDAEDIAGMVEDITYMNDVTISHNEREREDDCALTLTHINDMPITDDDAVTGRGSFENQLVEFSVGGGDPIDIMVTNDNNAPINTERLMRD